MFKYVHHIHYLVRDRDAMVEYLEKNFGMKPDQLVEYTDLHRKEACYDIGQTQLQIVEPTDTDSTQAQHLAKFGPGVYHVAWAIDKLDALVPQLLANGNKVKYTADLANEKILTSPRGYQNCNLDPPSAHGLWFQLVGVD